MPTDEQVKECFEGAFRPLRCYTEIFDARDRIKFQVFDAEDNRIFEEMQELFQVNLEFDPKRLQSILSWYRDRVKEKGFRTG
uniref:hypothetical protein n=1 Tax=Candidatus Electronema sp. TaxID=2698783 RepID=UPI004056DC66